MLARGDSVGVFQFESEGMQEALSKVRPTEFDDLVALNALYRPGAMDQIPTYARGKRDPDAVTYPRPAARADHRPDLRRDPVPGAGDADLQGDRRLLGRARPTTCARRSARRTARRWRSSSRSSARAAARRARATRVIDWLWTTNEKSADYSFNRSHAACYALIAYRTAWLKANYPAEYMAALISSVMDTKDKVPVLRQPGGVDGHRDPAARRQRLRPRVRRRRGQHPLRARRREGRRLRGCRGDQGRPRRGRELRVALGLLRTRRRTGGEQEGHRGAGQVRCVRLHRRVAQGHAHGARAGPGRRGRRPSRTPRSARARSSTVSPTTAAAESGGDGGVRRARSTRRSRPRSSTSPRCWRSRRSRSACSSPRTRSSRCARRCACASTAAWPSSPTARTATGSPPAASSRRPRRSAPATATT